ncbi:MAG: cytochrome-c oxidase, cbb3-type subunit I [Ignavibacteria bacterium]|nr:cytochrome-c oxidase, cbb3-type subunit I [Ignavibacteria bacterium]
MNENVPSVQNANGNNARVETIAYDNNIVRLFAVASLVWGLVGFLVGILVAIKFYLPEFLGGIDFLSFGRLRPLHTNAVIFAFAGNAIFFGVYYSLQRLCKARMFSDLLSKIHFYGWQFIIVVAAITLPLGITSGKEYAELEFPVDILIALVWVAFGVNMMGTIFKRREKHMYVAIWFYIATFLTVAVLHIVNSFAIPVSFLKSYSMYAGVQDALVQWWYGHNAVAFFLTTPFLGIMYYFVPKAAGRPVYSYRLSIIHFWALIFLYIWAGPHHLLYTALPDWAQSLGVVFSLMLIAPSWGGMINGLLTLRGAWDKVRTDPVLKFFVVGITAYGMSTFEGPMMSLKNINAVTHYTDYIIAHVHLGALLWNGGLAFAMMYYIFPRIYKTKLHSISLANWHFWLMTLGVLIYVIPLYWGGIMQSLMWKEFLPDGTLRYPNFLDTVTQIIPMYIMRSVGGTVYLIGACVGAYNLWKTAKSGKLVRDEEAQVVNMRAIEKSTAKKEHWHRFIEGKPLRFSVLVVAVVLIGGIVEYVPTALIKSNIPTISTVTPYTPLELEGRDIYVREGCFTCHSQMIRPFRSETERYGDYSKPGEFVYDHPFQWGSKRTGPDLHRVGGRYPDAWHWKHMFDPRSTSPNSIMPAYTWLYSTDLDVSHTEGKILTMQKLGVPYPDGYAAKAVNDLQIQSKEIAASLAATGIKNVDSRKEIVSVIAYLQRLGTDVKKNPDNKGKE